jgi:hypothetical protein
MEKLTAKQETFINSLLTELSWDDAREKNNLSLKQIAQFEENIIFVEELKKRQHKEIVRTKDNSHIYIRESQKALYKVIKTSKNERNIVESAKILLKSVYDNIDMIETLHTRYEIDDLKKQLSLDLDIDSDA